MLCCCVFVTVSFSALCTLPQKERGKTVQALFANLREQKFHSKQFDDVRTPPKRAHFSLLSRQQSYVVPIITTMSFVTSAAHSAAMADARPAIAIVTGGKSGIGKAIADKIATFPFIEQVLAVSRSIKDHDVADSPKILALTADVSTEEGRQVIVDEVNRLCRGDEKKQLRYLVHSAGTIDPIKPALKVQPEDLRRAMVINCEGPFFLSTALYPYMQPLDDDGVPGRILHVSSGAAHGAPPSGWSVYGISKAAFFQSYKVLEREFREAGGQVVVGSFKPGVVNTEMQGTIREAPESAMPNVGNFKSMKKKADASASATTKARPPPKGALDTPENVAFFAEYLLTGTTDEEFANKDVLNEYDIRDAELYPKWISAEVLAESE